MADIPRQRLNVDPRGYAGPMLPDLAGPAMGGGGLGIPREFMQMLAEAHAMRQRQAAAQLALMRDQLQGQRQERAFALRPPDVTLAMADAMYQPQGRARIGIGPQELGEAAASTLDPGNRLGRVGTDFSKLGKYLQFLGPEQVGAGVRTAGQGFANLAGQASANAPALASMQGPDQGPYSFLRGYPGAPARTPNLGYMGQYERGSLPGTVPKTGTYKLHKNEIVVSAPQVAPGGELDSQLMNALIEDKMRKGITSKNPKGHRGNSYAGGSLGYASSDIDPSLAAALGLDILPPRGVAPTPPAYRTPSFGEGLGMALGSGFGAIGKGAEKFGSFLADVERGYGGDAGGGDLAAALAKARVPATPEDLGRAPETVPIDSVEQLQESAGFGPEEQSSRDLEVALSRARGGDFGTRENPLTLSGSSGLGPNSAGITAPPEGRGDEYLPEAERGFAPESAEWRRAESQRTMATLNRQKADRIRDYLLSEGENMDPDTRKDLMKGAEWLDATAEMVETRHEERAARREELWSRSQDAVVRADAEIQKARAKGEEVRAAVAQKSLDALEDSYQDLQKSYIDIKGEVDDRGRERALRAMAQNRVAQAKLYGEDVSPEEAMLGIRLEMGEITPEEAQEELAALQGG